MEDLLVDIKENLTRLSCLCEALKALKFSPGEENIQQIPPPVLCEPKRSFYPDAAFYHYSASVSQNNKYEETNVTKSNLPNLKFNPIENKKANTLPVASVISEPKPKYNADSGVVESETTASKEAEAVPQNYSSTREIMMMVDGKEVNIISIRPKLIKKKC